MIDLSLYENKLTLRNQVGRMLWTLVWAILARPLPRSMGNKWKILLLRLFGAQIDSTAVVYSSVRIYMPWNLRMAPHSCLAPGVDCYNVDKIDIGAHTTISQKTYLCAASHDISKPSLPLVTAPITIGNQVWVAADAFIGPGVEVGEGAVIAACACVVKNVPEWTVVGANPAKVIKERIVEK